MMTLFDQSDAVDAYANERYEAGHAEGQRDLVKSLLSIGSIPIEDIQKATGWSQEQINALKSN